MLPQPILFCSMDILGYNNGVGILNNIGKACYSNKKYGAVGRSFNLDDLEKQLTVDLEQYRITSASSSSKYPFIHSKEVYSNVSGTLLLPGSNCGGGEKAWERSEQKQFIPTNIGGSSTPGAVVNSTTLKSYAYDYTKVSSSQKYENGGTILGTVSEIVISILKKNESANKILERYFIASRTFTCYSGTLRYGLVWHAQNDFRLSQILATGNNQTDLGFYGCIRPAVDIRLSDTILGESGSGVQGNGWVLFPN